MRLRYEEAKRRIANLKIQLAKLDSEAWPGVLDSERDRLILISEKEKLHLKGGFFPLSGMCVALPWCLWWLSGPDLLYTSLSPSSPPFILGSGTSSQKSPLL